MTGRAVMTLATTKTVYVDMAIALARSFNVWNRGSGIAFHIVTDLDIELPPDLSNVHFRRVPSGALGIAFSAKLHLDSLAPAPRTLFVDADCLCVGPLGSVFDRFAGRAVSVAGGRISTGPWFGDVAQICRRIGRPSLPKFNGGIYYLEPGPQATAVYMRARELEQRYDAWGLVRLRGHPNDELLMAIAMAEAGLEALADDDTIMAPFNVYPEFRALDVFAGRCEIANPAPPHRLHEADYPVRATRPLLPHFVNNYTDHWRYRAEVLKLRLVAAGMPLWLARFAVACGVAAPGVATQVGKVTLRPIYRRLFGVRRVRSTSRV